MHLDDIQNASAIAATLIHLGLAHTECVTLSKSAQKTKLFLGKHAASSEAKQALDLIMFNLGSYDFLLSLCSLYGIILGSADLVRIVMAVYIFRSCSTIWTGPRDWPVFTFEFLSSLIALVLPSKFESEPEILCFDRLPINLILLSTITHILFFLAESIFFSQIKAIRKVFLGRLAESPPAVEIATTYMFNMGMYNLSLAVATLYGMFVLKSCVVITSMLSVYVGAAFALLYSSPRMYRGFLIQGMPAFIALYMLRHTLDDQYYHILTYLTSEEGDHDH